MGRLIVIILGILISIQGIAMGAELSDLEAKLSELKQSRKQAASEYRSRIDVLKNKIRQENGNATWLNKSIYNLHNKQLHDKTLVMRYDYNLSLSSASDDTWGLTSRFEWAANEIISIALDAQYIYRQKYPFSSDDKGFLGDTRGIGGLVNVIYRSSIPYESVSPYMIGGVGVFGWGFHENPYLQDRNTKVELDTSFAYRVGGGVDWWIAETWAVNMEIAYFNSQIPKNVVRGTGAANSVLGSGEIDNSQVQFSVGARYKF